MPDCLAQRRISPQIAGSREYSAKTYLEALNKIEEKIVVLQENLGDKIGLQLSKLQIVKSRAQTMATEARRIVDPGLNPENIQRWKDIGLSDILH